MLQCGGRFLPLALGCALLALPSRGLKQPTLGASLAQKAARAADTGRQPSELEHVKSLIRDMIASKQADLSDSVSRKEFCSSEMEQSKVHLEKLQFQLEKQTADHDRLEAELAEHIDSVADLQAAEVEARKALAKSAEVRARERAAYDKDKEQYEHGKLGGPSWKSAASSGAVEESSDSILKTRIKAATSEAAQDLAFRRQQQKTQDDIKQKAQAVQRHQSDIVRMRSQLSEAERDKQSTQERLASAKSYRDQVERQCIVQADPLRDRKMRRDAQIASLKEAYNTLAG